MGYNTIYTGVLGVIPPMSEKTKALVKTMSYDRHNKLSEHNTGWGDATFEVGKDGDTLCLQIDGEKFYIDYYTDAINLLLTKVLKPAGHTVSGYIRAVNQYGDVNHFHWKHNQVFDTDMVEIERTECEELRMYKKEAEIYKSLFSVLLDQHAGSSIAFADNLNPFLEKLPTDSDAHVWITAQIEALFKPEGLGMKEVEADFEQKKQKR
jgi:hypothetical protein